MRRNLKTVFFIIILTGLIYGLGMYLSYDNGKVCDEVVIMNDGSQIESRSVISYENGMSMIRQCNGEEVETPTINIKMINHIKSPN
jgi:hypothetical protein